jgi:hypothetical protein
MNRHAIAASLFALLFANPARVFGEFSVEVDAAGELDGAVVVARPLDVEVPAPAQPDELSMVQINRQFDPFILPVPRNVPVMFPNKDNTAHHVYSFSPVGTFDLPLYKGDSPHPITFTESGVVPLGCNIHDWMIGYIYVVDSPWYTQMIHNVAHFEDLPAGLWEISIWHPALDSEMAPSWRVTVDGSQTMQSLALDFPFVAVRQPVPPIERFDELGDY